MTTKTVLTKELIDELAEKYLWGDAQFIGAGEVTVEGEEEFARAIEQAVMQSEQVQAWKRDAERMEWYFGSADKTSWVPEYMRGCNEGWSADQWRMSIDAAMEQQK